MSDSSKEPLLSPPTTIMNAPTANNLRHWLRANNLEGSETIPTAVLLTAIDEAPPVDAGSCHRRFKRAGRIACIIVAVAIVVNFITVLSLFLTSWDSTPLDVYALVVSTLFFGTLMLGGVFWMGVKKGKGELEGEGRILLGQEA